MLNENSGKSRRRIINSNDLSSVFQKGSQVEFKNFIRSDQSSSSVYDDEDDEDENSNDLSLENIEDFEEINSTVQRTSSVTSFHSGEKSTSSSPSPIIQSVPIVDSQSDFSFPSYPQSSLPLSTLQSNVDTSPGAYLFDDAYLDLRSPLNKV